ncbi:tRNA lysidine(34) synthetase TilS [Propioniciclava soli]|uniref:tRNA(Ile)-lysidine synthase n=1 Tax=Propioniciclava soli TaxID=2775081 RepID=A0ABZ3C919_9ACTN
MARRALGPATLRVVQAVDALAPAPWLVACSGGADSLALAWAAHHVATRRGTPARALVVDHQLQAGSDAVAARVVATLAAFGLDAHAVPVVVGHDGAGPEASARAARHAALAAGLAPDERVLLGHTLDDQAETVLLGLARGSGLASLGGMAAARDHLSRPLLGLRRDTTRACCDELGLTPWDDPMNADRHFARVRVRDVVLPVLEAELGPGVAEALARTAQIARAASEELDARAPFPDALAADCAHLAGLAPGQRRRALRAWLLRMGAVEAQAVHVAAVERLVTAWRGQRGVDVPGGRVARRDGRLTWTPRSALG